MVNKIYNVNTAEARVKYWKEQKECQENTKEGILI